LDLFERGFDALRELQRVDRRLLLNSDNDRRLRIMRAFAAFERRAFAHRADVTDQDGRRARGLDVDSGDRTDIPEMADTAHQVLLPRATWNPAVAFLFAAVNARSTSSSITWCAARRAGSSTTSYCFCSPPVAMTCDTPGTARRRRRTFSNRSNLQSGVPVRLEVDEQHLTHDRRDGRQESWLDGRRQRPGHERESLGHCLSSAVDVSTPVEFHPHDRHADSRRGPDAADARRPVQGRFDREGDE
jgi:hypothetical protein